MSGRGSLRNGGDLEIVTAPVIERHSRGMDAGLPLVPRSGSHQMLPRTAASIGIAEVGAHAGNTLGCCTSCVLARHRQ